MNLKIAVVALSATLALVGTVFVAAERAEAAAPAQAANIRLNPNTASEVELRTVPQLNAGQIATIQRSKPFANTAAFNTAMGVTVPDQVKALNERVFVPINLNTASREEIALIPGMTPRMVREFLEYRPYANIDQFNREMAKYVDAAEVARLRSYVTLN